MYSLLHPGRVIDSLISDKYLALLVRVVVSFTWSNPVSQQVPGTVAQGALDDDVLFWAILNTRMINLL